MDDPFFILFMMPFALCLIVMGLWSIIVRLLNQGQK